MTLADLMETKAATQILRSISQFRIRSFLPVALGISLGFALSMLYIPVVEQLCLVDIEESKQQNSPVHPSVAPNTVQLVKKKAIGQLPIISSSHDPSPTPVKPKRSQFNYDFRPYFVYSELGFKFKLIVGVLTSESRLDSFAVAINNTWMQELPKVLFFTPYSKNINFHEKYNRRLNLNVVQLPDIDEESSPADIAFRMLQYMRDHYIDNYNWFMRVTDDVYVNSGKLLAFLNSVNSSEDFYLGHAKKFGSGAGSGKSLPELPSEGFYCLGEPGVVLSRSALSKVVPHFDTCSRGSRKSKDDIVLGRCIAKHVGISCAPDPKISELFQTYDSVGRKMLSKLLNLEKALVLSPIQSSKEMIEIHKHFTLKGLKHTFDEMYRLQAEIKAMVSSLPDGVPEKKIRWPVGFSDPFKPSSRFEVIPWSYFTEKELFGNSDVEPVSVLMKADKRDIDEVVRTTKDMMMKEYSHLKKENFRLLNGYRRLDPQRGNEYILDIEVIQRRSKPHIRRVHLLRPFTKVEALQLPAATEQRGIHLVLPVLRSEIDRFEKFLQMYKRVCLQTGENVVLLTVFINIREKETEFDQRDDPFSDAKNLISRYKHSYMWAQLPWLQVGVKNPSHTLIMDIVSMKLPSNALIFLVSLSIDFTINFLNRCRVNAVSGIQVFFPIPFAEFNPNIVYQGRQKPTFVDVYRNNGVWDRQAMDVACFSNKDYKDLRMNRDDFLDENQKDSSLLSVFKHSKFTVFRAVDAELRRRFVPVSCSRSRNTTSFRECTAHISERQASRSQLAQYLFKKENM